MSTRETTYSYRAALDAAIQAAREAGDILRKELHRPDGPRGHGGHCPADEEAEAVIRQRLTAAFPDFGIVGEELGSQDRRPADPGRHVWLIDPHDGTSAFIANACRGTAVSIGLIQEGVPVLGVVYAFAYPDDAGDMIAWAKGCDLTRQGKIVHRRPWAAMPDPAISVAVSLAAEKSALANAQLVAPMRFRTVPSIAYRLALAAVGDVEVGVSLYSPVCWDYAGGDALLRAVGGTLLDTDAREIVYSIDGESLCGGRCFGGAPALCKELAHKDWESVSRRDVERSGTPAPFSILTGVKGRAVTNTALLRRAQGCLLGQLAGDALGGLVEFQSASSIQRRYPHGVRELIDGGTWNTLGGQPTDDSEMALMLARTLVERGEYDAEAAARGYVYWFQTPPFDLGSTTAQALSAAAAAPRMMPSASAAMEAASHFSQANGSLMRISPLGIFAHSASANDAAAWARADARLTHPHVVCQSAAAVYVVAIQFALRTGESPRAVYDAALAWAATGNIDPNVMHVLTAASEQRPDDYATRQGWVLVALQNAFYQLLHAGTLEEGAVDTVMQGGDTDTNAAIATALLGAVHGIDGISRQWLDRVITCRPVDDLSGVTHPRPKPLWPTDAMVLAERLLTARK